ncbi:MAG: 16S rRNA (uracil(1498)-N(3))-methyltransferase [Pseudomonadota bacterium]
MKHRLYHPPPIAAGSTLALDRERTHYLTRVLRLRPGAAIVCFDGAGGAWSATLMDAGRTASLAVGEQIANEPAPRVRVHLVQGLLKGGAMDQVVQKATELGATDIWLVHAGRSNAPTGGDRMARKQRHWQRVVASAAEQCGVLHLPRLHAPRNLPELLRAPPAARLIMLDPGAEPLPVTLPRASVALLIGPEGGWNDDERRLAAQAGVERRGLGERVVRAETAPLAVLAALQHGWGWP